MITRFTIENFKGLDYADLDLGQNVVCIGPNNSGKTSALQALALWDVGWRRWVEKRDKSAASQRTGVTINRRDILSIPTPSARLLWKDLHTRNSSKDEAGKQKTQNIYITLTAEGVFNDRPWTCKLQFYYANEESLYCRLLEGDENDRVPEGARRHQVVFLPPMSGLADREYRKEVGEINVLMGEGRTAEVLRNLCYQLHQQTESWDRLAEMVADLFEIKVKAPVYIPERSEIQLAYRTHTGIELDISSSGRGCHQVLLLLSYLLSNPNSVLLMDEPDAHLEILRQREVYNLITELATEHSSQILAASHSEVVLQEAAVKDVVIAFVGKPHRIDTHTNRNQLRKVLESIQMADYYIAEQCGWFLYLEGSTDLAILQTLAKRLEHPAAEFLTGRVPVFYLETNKPQGARDHFFGLREAKPDLRGFALFDRLDKNLNRNSPLVECMWRKREIENYLTSPQSIRGLLLEGLSEQDLLERAEAQNRSSIFEKALNEFLKAFRIMNPSDPWGPDLKVTDEFLDPFMRNFYDNLGTPQRIFKRDYHRLATHVELEKIDTEVTEKLDLLLEVAADS